MKEELHEFIHSYNVEKRTIELFLKNFNSYKEGEKDEFLECFGEFQESLFEYKIKKYSYNISEYLDYDYVSVTINMYYKEKYMGEYMCVFDMEGNVTDDYFVMGR